MEKILQFLIYLLNRWQNRESLKTLGAARSPKWNSFRKEQIKLRGGKCELCGGIELLELHHIESYSSNPSRELDPTNVIILCESGRNGIVCHRAFGHLGNYQKINPDVVIDCKIWNLKLKHS